jgi:hypothetical protein
MQTHLKQSLLGALLVLSMYINKKKVDSVTKIFSIIFVLFVKLQV